MPRPCRAQGQGRQGQVYRRLPTRLPCPRDMFLSVWPEPDLAGPVLGKDLQANAIGCRAHVAPKAKGAKAKSTEGCPQGCHVLGTCF